MSYIITGFSLFASCDWDCTSNKDTYKRTVIAYIGRDNNLKVGYEDKIQSMLEGWNGRNGNLIIYQDTAVGNSGLMEVYTEKGVNKIKTVREFANENSADPNVFKRVLNDAISLYPADSYGLIIFSHASGWLPEATLASPRSFFKDGKDEMELTDMAAAIPAGYFDFIVFETCFSAGIEVAYELKDKTNYIIASSAELLSPGFKEIYASSLNYLFEKEPKLEAFTRNIFTLMNESDAYYKSVTVSLIKTEKLADLGAFLHQYIDDGKINGVNPYDVQHFDRYSYRLFFDFEDYYSRILSDDAPAQELNALLNECVPYKDATPSFLTGSSSWMGFDIKRHSGLTTYIRQEYFPYLNQEYKKLAWYKAVFE
ncbi:MAG: hypothetical protein LBK45_05690 [Tannerellaceae bacterium]|nr:hypothetical protein [Tannerellaceae bacterium]